MTDHYERCYACGGHVFKPKRLTKQALENREGCICMCHWNQSYSLGITYQEALVIYNKQKTKTQESQS